MAQVNETRRGTLHRPVETFLGKAILKGFFFFFFFLQRPTSTKKNGCICPAHGPSNAIHSLHLLKISALNV
ncbi:hypothetical protein ACKS0A_02355 [Histoplasma ohiense]